MSDEQQEGAGSERRFQIQKLYLKDVSFESPAAPGIFGSGSEWQPQISFQLDTEHNQVGDTLHEIVLGVTVTAQHGERTAFLVELKQAGLFDIAGFEAEEFEHMLGSYCPGILYPYARAAVGDLVQKGGLPQLVLQPINFDLVYARQRARQQSGDGEAAPNEAADASDASDTAH
jgi:preprotein translocase subunit SecB